MHTTPKQLLLFSVRCLSACDNSRCTTEESGHALLSLEKRKKLSPGDSLALPLVKMSRRSSSFLSSLSRSICVRDIKSSLRIAIAVKVRDRAARERGRNKRQENSDVVSGVSPARASKGGSLLRSGGGGWWTTPFVRLSPFSSSSQSVFPPGRPGLIRAGSSGSLLASTLP